MYSGEETEKKQLYLKISQSDVMQDGKERIGKREGEDMHRRGRIEERRRGLYLDIALNVNDVERDE